MVNGIYDVIIVGLGAMGSSAACNLAQRKQKILGIDRFTPPHAMGSSHGQTRIIREAYFEGPQYVSIIQKAYENWEKLEQDSGQQLYVKTGGLMIGYPDSDLVKGALLSATTHKLSHEIFDSTEIKKRYPAFNPDDKMIALYETRAGILFPEKCIIANLTIAEKHGSSFNYDENVTGWRSAGDILYIKTNKQEYQTRNLLVTAGAWLKQLFPELQLPLSVERQVLYWFDPFEKAEYFKKELFPINIWAYGSNKNFYSFPDMGQGIKVAIHHEGEITEPDLIDRKVHEKEIIKMRSILQLFIPRANGKLRAAEVCMYTNTADSHFLISQHPDHRNILTASICSGHGFKFASAFGEILTDIILENRSAFDLSLFGYIKGRS